MTTSAPLPLSDMPLPQAVAYYFRLQHMQNLLGRHRSWRTCLRAGLLFAMAAVAYGIASGMLTLTLLALSVASIFPVLLITLPARLQCQHQRDIAALLRDLPLASDSQSPSLREISRLLQAPAMFESVLADWLQQEIARCRQNPSLQIHQR